MIPHHAVLEYDGTHFSGWQRQGKGERTVQSELERALARINGAAVTAQGAGRTDSGVHALGQVASFNLARSWDPGDLVPALNNNTPPDMRIRHAGPAPPGFHARKHATSRRYRYVVGCDEAARSPFRAPYEWALCQPLDVSILYSAAGLFRGEHDFAALSSVGQEKPHYRCIISEAAWALRENGEGFIFTVEANRFLHRMVRFLVGAMVDVGRARRPLDDITNLLMSADNRTASPPAPPQGLYFVSATYPELSGEPT